MFRHMVDVILLNDFLSYVLFSLSFLRLAGPPGHSALFHVLRWTGGVVLLLFNLWVKTDAHRIVKDFACVLPSLLQSVMLNPLSLLGGTGAMPFSFHCRTSSLTASSR